jgi:hypothetical protein
MAATRETFVVGASLQLPKNLAVTKDREDAERSTISLRFELCVLQCPPW